MKPICAQKFIDIDSSRKRAGVVAAVAPSIKPYLRHALTILLSEDRQH